MKLDTYKIREKKIEVFINPAGEFTAEYNGQLVKAPTLEAIKEKLERVVKADKIAPIPFIQWNGETLICGKALGIHVGNGNLLIKIDGEKGVEQHFRLEDAIDPVHLVEYAQLCSAARAAEDARKAFEEKHSFNLKERVKAAMAAMDGAGERNSRGSINGVSIIPGRRGSGLGGSRSRSLSSPNS